MSLPACLDASSRAVAAGRDRGRQRQTTPETSTTPRRRMSVRRRLSRQTDRNCTLPLWALKAAVSREQERDGETSPMERFRALAWARVQPGPSARDRSKPAASAAQIRSGR